MFFYKWFKISLVVSFMFFILAGTCYAQMPGLLGKGMPEMYGKFRIDKVGGLCRV